MTNLHDHIRDNITSGKLICDDLIFCDYRCMEPNVYLPIWSQQHYFIHVVSGQKSWSSRKNEYMAPVGTTLFIEKGASLARQFFDEEMCMLMFFYTDAFIREVIGELPSMKGAPGKGPELDTVVEVDNSEALMAYFNSVLPFFMQDPPAAKDLLRLKFKELLLHVFTHPGNQELAFQLCALCASGKPSIKRTMEENFMRNLKLEDFAEIAGRSLSGFKREFQQLYNTSPGKWLVEQRLRFAQDLLGTAQRQVNEVAWQSGFEDVSHFSRAFKERFGCTPTQYRASQLA